MRKHALLIAVVLASLGMGLLCLCFLGAVAIRYLPSLMERVGMADRYVTEFDAPRAGLTIINLRGDITVRVRDVERVQVEATKIAQAITEAQARRVLARTAVRIDRREGRIVVRFPHALLAKAPTANLVVTVPRDMALYVLAEKGNIRASLPEDARYILDAQTRIGRIESLFPLVDREADLVTGMRDAGQWLRGRTDAESKTELVLRAKRGDITIESMD